MIEKNQPVSVGLSFQNQFLQLQQQLDFHEPPIKQHDQHKVRAHRVDLMFEITILLQFAIMINKARRNMHEYKIK